MQKVKAGIIGHTGRSGRELQQILLKHPLVEKELAFTSSRSEGEKGDKKQVDVMFLALPPEESIKEVPSLLAQDKKVIDLSRAYRSDITAAYGLPECNKGEIKNTRLIANPGCYATSIILGLLPIADFVTTLDVIAYSGISGAGKYPIKNGEIRKYLDGRQHPHISEIERMLCAFVSRFDPHVVEFSDRGIISKIKSTLRSRFSYEEVLGKYRTYYTSSPFVKLEDEFRDIALENIKTPEDFDGLVKDVVCSNYCKISISLNGLELTVISRLDNLVKGAAGLAVQNMNIMYGFDEKTGLV